MRVETGSIAKVVSLGSFNVAPMRPSTLLLYGSIGTGFLFMLEIKVATLFRYDLPRLSFFLLCFITAMASEVSSSSFELREPTESDYFFALGGLNFSIQIYSLSSAFLSFAYLTKLYSNAY